MRVRQMVVPPHRRCPKEPRVSNPADFTPIHVYANASLQANSQVAVNAQALQNPLGGPMEIHEIRFKITADLPESAFAAPDPITGDMGALIAVKLDLGTIELTNGFVPAWALGMDEDQYANVQYFENLPSGVIQKNSSYYRWRLPKPLYVPAGATVVPQFQHRGFSTVPVQIGIGYSGRALPANAPPPQTNFVPWVTSYFSKAFVLSDTATDFDTSSNTDIFNKWDQPVQLQRLGIHCPMVDLAAGSWYEWTVNVGSMFDYIQTRIVDSGGLPVVRKYTPIGQLVNPSNRTWEMSGAIMPPGSFWNVFLRCDPVLSPPLTKTLVAQPQVALVGYRKA